WYGNTYAERLLGALTLAPLRPFDWTIAGWFICFLVLTVWSFRFLRTSVSLYGVAVLAIPYFTLGVTASTNRFVLVCLPAFMMAALLGRGRYWLSTMVVGVQSALLFRTTAMYSQWYWVG